MDEWRGAVVMEGGGGLEVSDVDFGSSALSSAMVVSPKRFQSDEVA